MPPSVAWFRRDLRLSDNPALLAAAADGPVLPLFVLDPALWRPAGPARRCYLTASLRSLDAAVGGLTLLEGDPVRRVVEAARAVGAERVHVAADFGPHGARRDAAVERALGEAGIALVRTGSPYAVAPGRLRTGGGTAYQVFTPYHRAWADHGWRAPAGDPADVEWLRPDRSAALPDVEPPAGMTLPEAGEEAAHARWQEFLDRVADYDDERDRPDLDTTSRMSVHLKWGEIHPRTMLADLAPLRSAGAAAYRRELAWRDFFADVLHARPETARAYLRPAFAGMRYDEPGAAYDAWRAGRTGFPVVDAGMRQLRATGWMHNRVRMVVASFLVKDLHVEWQHGARHFLHWLVDGDLASNQQNWQWAAGSGAEAAPYFRVFNPTSQGRKFDPDGTYVRRWVPELAEVTDPHDPSPDDRERSGYPAPVVDHAAERREALARWEEIR
ncbi:deoxyribodipyrimidine photo-lyase [Nocardioides sp. MAH-18]|uniref:Deoxyribodipyrimidine photo-lyase n=1 Tax=Nocardioides agri TaxID=2682843 RepID=A0A6L6XTD5_9ACTN|nr:MULTISPECIES: deoxyribodipyrimidine photo-lyase [unclassified Nocardioides]MBA2955801.1 deoxyribodipyrimidine photo-lyase [Nocardioides sp. CGMCC 1.13656]MVQ50651.1 deoxyribodipyrimidine photo-lyase [Nocardioides sp. MAH-18]